MFHARLILDRMRYFYSVYVKIGTESRRNVPLACHTLCELNLRRPHLTCLWCRPRRVYYNKMPSKIPVDLVILHVYQLQKHRKLKQTVRKFLLTLAGWTLN